MTLFREVGNDLSLLRIDCAATRPLSFCVNPFLGVVKTTLRLPHRRAYPLGANNQRIVEELVTGLRAGTELFWNFQYFLSELVAVTEHSDASSLLRLPLFLTYSQK
jgi:hypothetical protein